MVGFVVLAGLCFLLVPSVHGPGQIRREALATDEFREVEWHGCGVGTSLSVLEERLRSKGTMYQRQGNMLFFLVPEKDGILDIVKSSVHYHVTFDTDLVIARIEAKRVLTGP